MQSTPTFALRSLALLAAAVLPLGVGFPFAFIFAGDTNGIEGVTHPAGYTGAGGVLTVTVGINPTSPNAMEMEIPTMNVIAVFNALNATTGNLVFSPANNVPFAEFDFESVLLHEMGHSLGLAHCNLGSESGVPSADQDFTRTIDGPDDVFALGTGPDGIRGSADDVRGDDVNLNYFDLLANDPFVLRSPADQTQYTRNTAFLPAGDAFSANADRDVGAATGYPNTEAVMQQGTFNGEAQRTLAADDVAGIRYAAAGLDETVGTADDYTINLTYAGMTTGADIVIAFDDAQTGFAESRSSGIFRSPTHVAITDNNIFFNDAAVTWFFNGVALPVSLVAFDAAPAAGPGVDLTWATASEHNHSHFEVARSRDLASWQSVGRVDEPDLYDRAEHRHYSLHDAGAEAGGYYYRLRAVATDGSHVDADAVYVNLGVASFEVVLAGVPLTVASCAELRLREAGPVGLTVADASGRVVARWTQAGEAGVTTLELTHLLALTPGTYFLRVEQGGEAVTQRFVR